MSRARRAGSGLIHRSTRIDEHCGSMRPRQKRIDFVSFPIERQRVRTCFGRDDLVPAHHGNIDNVYYAKLTNGDIKVSRSRIEKNHVWSAAEGHIVEDTTTCSVDCEQDSRIAGAKQTSRYWIKLETMRAFGRHLIFHRHFGRVTRINRDDPCWRRNIDEERLIN